MRIKYLQLVRWASPRRLKCSPIWFGKGEVCGNVIRVIENVDLTSLLVCGTHSSDDKEKCRVYKVSLLLRFFL